LELLHKFSADTTCFNGFTCWQTASYSAQWVAGFCSLYFIFSKVSEVSEVSTYNPL